jgi:M6 family metalloprotease-like protein
MQKYYKKLVVVLLAGLSLTGCSLKTSSLSSSSMTSAAISTLTAASSATSSVSSVSSASSSNLLVSSSDKAEAIQAAYYRQYLKQQGTYCMPTTGNSKMLVVPVQFKGKEATSAEQETAEQRIDAAFFGTSEKTGWESVSSFYNKSSYGKLDIGGEVAPFYTTDETLNQYLASSNSSGSPTGGTNSILEGIYKTYFTGSDPKYKISDYDSDGDGTIDSVYMVYYYPYSNYSEETNLTDDSGFLWAYTYWENSNSYDELGVYSWSSYYFMEEGGYSLPDAHTFIHESGHILGLNDYYNCDPYKMIDGTQWYDLTAPAGGLTMQDNNVLDQDSMSKYSFGWIDPVAIDETSASATYSLKPFESSGDSIIIGNSLNGTAFDEYLIIEFYTPTGLNYMDSFGNKKYSNSYLQGFTVPGIKIYHADQRLGKISYKTEGRTSGWYWDEEYVENPNFSSSSSTDYYGMLSSNTPSYSNDGNNQLQLMEAEGTDRFITEHEFNPSNANALFRICMLQKMILLLTITIYSKKAMFSTIYSLRLFLMTDHLFLAR